MACIDNIVTIGICDAEDSLSGFTLMGAPGISPKNAASITTEQYNNQLAMLETIKANAIKCVRSDFNGFLQANMVATSLTNRKYDSASFNTSVNKGNYAGYRGQTIFANTPYQKGNMRVMKIYSVETYALTSGDGEIVIADFDNGVATETVYPTTFIANTKQVHELPTPYIATSAQVSVLIDNTTLSFSSSQIICGTGCGNLPKNTCATVEGFDGEGYVRKEGFGMNVIFSCDCNYDQLICDLTPSYTGELIWYKMQELFFEEALKSNRFTAFVTYNAEAFKTYISDLQTMYANKFNNMISGSIFDILRNYNDPCLNCRGIRKVTNI